MFAIRLAPDQIDDNDVWKAELQSDRFDKVGGRKNGQLACLFRKVNDLHEDSLPLKRGGFLRVSI